MSAIEYLTVAVPKNIIDRFGLDQKALADFERVTGIKKTRRFLGSTTEMILKALKACDFTAEDLAGVIVVTQSPDRLSPCMAMEVHNYLKLPPSAFAFDVNRACTGWSDGLMLATKMPGKTLLICADRLRYAPNPIEGLIFSDSVSISVINQSVEIPTIFFNDGAYSDKLYCGLNNDMFMNGAFIFDFVTSKVPGMIKEFNAKFPSDTLCLHQANLSMLKIVAMRSGFKDNWLSSIEEYGNQSMNSLPTSIVHNEEKALGKKLLLASFGAGVSATVQQIIWPEKSIGYIVQI
jgi:3-oxoacyl-[acyl-carrier-protein] synthase III